MCHGRTVDSSCAVYRMWVRILPMPDTGQRVSLNFHILQHTEKKYPLSVPSGWGPKTKQKRENKRTPWGNLKTRVLHKEFCVQSLRENLKDQGPAKENKVSLHWVQQSECVYPILLTQTQPSLKPSTYYRFLM